MKILIIDNNIDQPCWGSENISKFARQVPDAHIVVRRAPHEDLPSSVHGFERVLVSGSRTSAISREGWTLKLDHFIKKTIQERIPYLGICYGLQSLVRAIGGEKYLENASCEEYGWTKVQQNGSSYLLEGIPQEFYSFSVHADQVVELPPGFKNIARSERCAVQGCEMIDAPAFGIQFHPEKSLSEGLESLNEVRLKKPTVSLLNPTQGKVLYNEEVGNRLFQNFLNGKYLK